MTPVLFTDAELVELLEIEIDRANSMRSWAAAHDLSASYVSDVRNGRRRVSPRLAAALGFKRVEAWERAS